jgi:hypothetical protein
VIPLVSSRSPFADVVYSLDQYAVTPPDET